MAAPIRGWLSGPRLQIVPGRVTGRPGAVQARFLDYFYRTGWWNPDYSDLAHAATVAAVVLLFDYTGRCWRVGPLRISRGIVPSASVCEIFSRVCCAVNNGPLGRGGGP